MFDTPEEKAALKEAIDEATTGLVKKNTELLSELKEAKKGRQIDPSTVEKLEARIDELDLALAGANKAVKTATAQAEKAVKALETESAFTQKLLIDNGLGDALVKANVSNPTHLKAAKAMLRGDVKIVVDGENRKAMIGEKELPAYITEWAGSEEGKQFVAAPNNAGGGAHGGGSNKGAVTLKRAEFETRDPVARQAFLKDGGKLVD